MGFIEIASYERGKVDVIKEGTGQLVRGGVPTRGLAFAQSTRGTFG
jgi:hypothetical protein